ncbi:hypothetical protein PG987_010083 [Apiospora arundinis]
MEYRLPEQPGLEVVVHDAPEIERPGSSEPLTRHSGSPTPEYKPCKRDRRICGMRKRDYWIVFTIIVLCILGVVAGGVAGNRAKIFNTDADNEPSTFASSPNNAASSTTPDPKTTTPTSTSTSPFTTATSGILALDCPNIDGTNKTSSVADTTYTYHYSCESDASGSGGDGPKWNTTTIDDCVQQCSQHDHDAADRSCGGVVWNRNLTHALARGGNCYLKLGTVTTWACTDECVAAVAVLV